MPQGKSADEGKLIVVIFRRKNLVFRVVNQLRTKLRKERILIMSARKRNSFETARFGLKLIKNCLAALNDARCSRL